MIANPYAFVDVSMVEFDIMLPMDEVQCGILLNSPEGGYMIMYDAKDDSTPDNGFVVLKYSRESGESAGRQRFFVTGSLTDQFGDFHGVWRNLKFIHNEQNNTWEIYLDDQFAASFEDEAPPFQSGGYIGFRPTGPVYLDNIVVRGNVAPEDTDSSNPTYYDDDFEDDAPGSNPDYWMEEA